MYITSMRRHTMCYQNVWLNMSFLATMEPQSQLIVYIFKVSSMFTFSKSADCLHLQNLLIVYIFKVSSLLHFYLQDYPQLSQTYYVLLECLAQDHMSFLATMEPQVFMYILSSITEGLTALGGNLNYFTGAFTQKLLTFSSYHLKVQII